MTTDHLGSPRVVTDQVGTVVSRHDYTGFGKDIAEALGATTGGRTAAQGYGASDEVRKQYTGYERDEESGLEFAQARYYNGDHGRFTSTDPLTASADIKNPQTFNRYAYVLNSPYKYVDPLGLISSSTGACGNFCKNWDGGAISGAFSSITSWHSGWINGIDFYTLEMNIVYDKNQYTEKQAKDAVAETVKDLQSTYKEVGVKFQIDYTAGTRDSSQAVQFFAGQGVSRIGPEARASAINVFLYVTAAYSGASGSVYIPESQQIILWEGTNSSTPNARTAQAKLSSGALAHEIGHLLLHHALGAPTSNVVTNGLQDIDMGIAFTHIRLGLYKRTEKTRDLPITYKGAMSAGVIPLLNLGTNCSRLRA